MPTQTNKPRIFILEDDPQRQDLFARWFPAAGYDVTICADNASARAAFKPPYAVVCLDHDLGGQQMVDSDADDTGYQFAQWMPPGNDDYAIVHSYNHIGARRMIQTLNEKHYATAYRPFGPETHKTVRDLCALLRATSSPVDA